jgi:translation initiation factor IF-1
MPFFAGLLMGTSGEYWRDIIKKIYSVAGTNQFSWNDVTSRYPEITKSELSRLKCSEFIRKTKDYKIIKCPGKRQTQIRLWQLPGDSITVARTPHKVSRTTIARRRKKVKKSS